MVVVVVLGGGGGGGRWWWWWELSLKNLDAPGLLVHELLVRKRRRGREQSGQEREEVKLRYFISILNKFREYPVKNV